MANRVRIAAALCCLVASIVSASHVLARQPDAAPVDRPQGQVVTLHVDFGDDAGAYLRILEGRPATITLEEDGTTYGLLPVVQASGAVAVQVLSIDRTGDLEQVNLMETVVLDREQEGRVHRGVEVLRGTTPMTLTLVERSTDRFRAKANLEVALDPDGNEQRPRECCYSCHGRSYCGCAVETPCGSCCAWICCDLEWPK